MARNQGARGHGHVARSARSRPSTRVNARSVLGTPDRGTIEPGKLADIIVVNGNPLYDIIALSRVEVVVKDGVVHKGGPAARAARPSSQAR